MPTLMENVLLNVLLDITSKMENAFLLNVPSVKPTTKKPKNANMSALTESSMIQPLKNADLSAEKTKYTQENTVDVQLDFILLMEFVQNVKTDLSMTS